MCNDTRAHYLACYTMKKNVRVSNSPIFLSDRVGGEIKSTNGEHWVYYPDGTLKSIKGRVTTVMTFLGTGEIAIEYLWNGKTLTPKKESSNSYGIGVWNGLSMQWFVNTDKSASPGFFSDVFL